MNYIIPLFCGQAAAIILPQIFCKNMTTSQMMSSPKGRGHNFLFEKVKYSEEEAKNPSEEIILMDTAASEAFTGIRFIGRIGGVRCIRGIGSVGFNVIAKRFKSFIKKLIQPCDFVLCPGKLFA